MAKPIKRFRGGQCEAAIFENEIVLNGKKVKVKKVAFQKRYRDFDGEWKTTHSLDTNDMPKAILVLSKAYEYLVLTDEVIDDSASSEDIAVG